MQAQLEGKRFSIELAKKARRKRGAWLILAFGFLIGTFFINKYYFKNSTITEYNAILIAFSILSLIFGLIQIFDPLNYDEKAFCKIIEAAELVEKSITNPDFRKLAYQKLNKASGYLESIDKGDGAWYSNIKEIENRFIKNLKNRVAPAVLEGELSYTNLENIALVFTDSDVNRMESINQSLEKQIEERKIPQVSNISIITTFFNTKLGKITASLLIGYILITFFSLMFVLLTNQDFKLFITNNPSIILIGGTTLSGIISAFMLKEF